MPTNIVQPTLEMTAKKASALEERDGGELLPWLPCRLTLEIPIVRFTVGDLLKLAKDSVLETACHQSSDLPLRVNGQQVGWTEFEVVGERLAVRLTDLS